MPVDPPTPPSGFSPRNLRLPSGARRGPGTPDYQLVLFQGYVAMGWYGDVRREGIDAWREAIEQTARVAGGPIGLVTCVRASSPPPEGELRKAAGQLIFHEVISVSMLVFEGSGFRAAIVRSVLAMMFALAGSKNIAHKVIGDPKEATRWFHEHSREEPWHTDLGELRELIDALLTAT